MFTRSKEENDSTILFVLLKKDQSYKETTSPSGHTPGIWLVSDVPPELSVNK